MASEVITKNDLKSILDQVLSIEDTGWQTLNLSSGSGTLQYRVINKIVYIIGTGLNVTHNTTFTTLPAAIRPTIRITCSASYPLDKNIYVNLYANGQMAGIQNGGGAISNMFFNMSYPI